MSRRKLSTKDWIVDAVKKHGNVYDYSKVVYTKYGCRVKIICPTHGEFEQTEYNHRNGAGCPQCGMESRKKARSHTFGSFLEKARAVHGDAYDYETTEIANSRSVVTMTCPEHGVFKQMVYSHLNGKGCRQCGYQRNGRQSRIGISEFLKRAEEVHGDTYEYLSGLSGLHKNIKIKCSVHGVFKQTPHNHLKGAGCPKCVGRVSKGETELFEFVKSLDVGAEASNRTLIKPYEVDVYVPQKGVAFEYNGLYYHREELVGNKTLTKQQLCAEKGVTLVQIFEDEWRDSRDKVERRIAAILGKSRRIPARKCRPQKINKADARAFLEKHHMQGAGSVLKHAYGLYQESCLVAVMTFGEGRFGHDGWELLRYASDGTVVGGISKLLRTFRRDHPEGDILSYADMRWGSGDSYGKVGFELVGITEPDYWWVDTKTLNRIPRYRLQKRPKGVSERKYAESLGWYKVKGVGHKKWLLRSSH